MLLGTNYVFSVINYKSWDLFIHVYYVYQRNSSAWAEYITWALLLNIVAMDYKDCREKNCQMEQSCKTL